MARALKALGDQSSDVADAMKYGIGAISKGFSGFKLETSSPFPSHKDFEREYLTTPYEAGVDEIKKLIDEKLKRKFEDDMRSRGTSMFTDPMSSFTSEPFGKAAARPSVMAALRIIREKCGVSTVDSGREFPADEKLARALIRIPHLDLMLGDTMNTLVSEWSDLHTSALNDAIIAGSVFKDALKTAKGKPIMKVWVNESDALEAATLALLKPKSEHSPEAQLEIDLQLAELEQDPFYGSF